MRIETAPARGSRRIAPGIACLAAVILALVPARAQAAEASGVTDSTELSYLIPFKVYAVETVNASLFSFRIGADATPVSVSGNARITFVPCPVFSAFVGAACGTGWNIPIGKGMALNAPDPSGMPMAVDRSLGGVLWDGEIGCNAQFDLGAVVPGTWTHVFFLTTQLARYRAFTGATNDESWYWVDGPGENRNGWRYWAYYIVGYKLPIALDAVGIYAESERFLSGGPEGASWGEGYCHWTFGPVCDIRFSERLNLNVMVLFHNVRNFVPGTESLFYQSRVLDGANPERLTFCKVGAKFIYRLR
ncbi:MAG TPA: hypothetical protein PKO22_08345 [Treponemataceae bacterium]|nr:hypothetical protein [Treponemataceae bacterium]